MAKVETDPQAQAVTTLVTGLGLKRKQELIERNDRLRFQFLQKQKMGAGKAREAQINAFLEGVVAGDKKMRELVFQAWLKDNTTALGEIPEFSDKFKRESEDEEEVTDEDLIKETAAEFKKWIKNTDPDLVAVYARLGFYEFPAKVLSVIKKPKEKAAPEAAEGGGEGGGGEAGGVSESVLAEVRQQLERQLEQQREQFEAKAARQDEEIAKFKRLLEENKDKRKSELAEASEKAKAELTAKQAEWQRVEAQLRREIAELNKAKSEASDKTSKARDELLPLRQQTERLERELRRANQHHQEAREAASQMEEEATRLRDRIKSLESTQQQLVAKERMLQKFETKGASMALTSSDNLKIWEESLNEQEVKETFKRTFNVDTISQSSYENDERDLHDVWKKLVAVEANLVDRFFALPFDELHQPSDEFKDLITSFIELKDSLVAREQLAHMINFVGNRFLSTLKTKV